MKWFALVLVFACVAPTEAATINAASCSQANVASAIASAAPGDTVQVPAGTCSWSGNISFSGIQLIGAGSSTSGTVITAGLVNIAAARGIRLTEVRSTVVGDIDLNGILGLNPDVRNGYEKITVRLSVKGDAPAEKLRALVEQSRSRSAVYDVITNRVPVTIEVDTP